MKERTFNSNYNSPADFTSEDDNEREEKDEAGSHEDQGIGHIDLNEQLVRNKHQTFFFRMNGDFMKGAGIFCGDTLIVDRSITNVNGKVVVALLNGEMLVRRLEKTFNKIRLIPETTNLSPIDIDPFAEFTIWGVVTYAIHAP
jgi:DNA polymerase V